MCSFVGEGMCAGEAFLQPDYLHPRQHRLPHIDAVLVAHSGAGGKLIGSYHKLLALELMFEFGVFVLADRSAQALAHKLD